MSETLSIIQIYAGQPVPAVQKIQLFSPDEWEMFVEEWLTYKQTQYTSVERLGGAGDQGRDVVGIVGSDKEESYVWDNFQCKHYAHPLMPSDVWHEFGKLCYFTFKRDFPVPRKYYFVAPQGIGTTLSNYLRKPDLCKAKLIENWTTYCEKGITQKSEIRLEGPLLSHVQGLDFRIFDKLTPLTLVQDHQKTRFHVARFGGGLPPRPDIGPMPKEIRKHELPYVNKLLKAYSSDSLTEYKSVGALPPGHKYSNHLSRSREYFHKAEQLRNFSRDTLPPGVFEAYKAEIYSGTIDITDEEHANGFKCVKEVEKEARKLSMASNPLSVCSDGNDRVGTCHHLANEGKLSWLEDEE